MTKNKAGSLALAFLIAFGLWMYVVTYVSTEHENTYYNVPVALSGESALTERGLMLLTEEEFRVNVTVSGSRQDVSKISVSDLQVVAKLDAIYDPGNHELSYEVVPPGNIATGALSFKKAPDRVNVVVARRKTKEIPVKVDYSGDVPADYIKDTAALELDYSYVEISGPEDVVDAIDHALITIDCEGRTETINESHRFALKNAGGQPVDAAYITTDVSEIRVNLPVAMVKKIPLVLTVVDGGGATEETTKIVMEPKEITVSGNETALAAMTELNLGTVDLKEITQDQELELEIALPEGITNVSNLPTAKVSISFPRLATREFTITEFDPVNLAPGMTWEPLTKQLTITVRGLKSEVQRLSAADIQAQVDLSGVENTSAVEPAIIFPKSYESLGVLGNYSISVQVTPGEITEE